MPSRTCTIVLLLCFDGLDPVPAGGRLDTASGVGEELAVDRIADPAVEASQRFEGCPASGEFASVVLAPGGVVADLRDGCGEMTWFIRRFPARGRQ